MLNVPVASLFNAIGNCLQMEIALKLYTTVFQLVCKILYDKKTFFNFSTYSVFYKKSSIIFFLETTLWHEYSCIINCLEREIAL